MSEDYMNIEEDINCITYSGRIIKAVVKLDDEATKQAIKDYALKEYPKENVRVDFLNKDIVDEIIIMGLAEYQRRKVLKELKGE